MKIYSVVPLICLVLVACACGPPSTAIPLPTYTPHPTYTPYPTHTSAPTDVPEPTATDSLKPTTAPEPTATVAPTTTPEPTVPPEPTATPEPTADMVAARCVAVVDGDTIDVEVGGEIHRVRYIGIDTPETVHPQKPVEWMGKEATEANRQLVGGRDVYLEKDVSETDQYGRLLRYVHVEGESGELIMVNEELVCRGYARVSTYPPDVRHQERFLEAERQAREAGVGLWGPTPVATAVPPTATPFPPTYTPIPPTPTPVPPTPAPGSPTAVPPTPVPTGSSSGDVRITFIYYDGQVPQVESDEYAAITNMGGHPVNLAGWRLNADDAGQDFYFPDFVLQPGQECRVYTNEYHPEWCGFSFGSGSALWANSGECGHLFDASGVEVSTYCYP